MLIQLQNGTTIQGRRVFLAMLWCVLQLEGGGSFSLYPNMQRNMVITQRIQRPTTHLYSASPYLPANEFSRTLSPDRILQRGRHRRIQHDKDYTLAISATSEECAALASRFDLADIRSLEAHVAVRAAPSSGGVEVEGRVMAAVTQTCVRTNEDFPVQVEVPLYAIVRPVAPLMGATPGTEPQPSHKPKRKGVSYRSSSALDDENLLEIQRLLELDTTLNDNDNDNDNASLMEDEAIYSLGGDIDIGELVAQLFWLSLDPYPKRPGTDPIQTSISG